MGLRVIGGWRREGSGHNSCRILPLDDRLAFTILRVVSTAWPTRECPEEPGPYFPSYQLTESRASLCITEKGCGRSVALELRYGFLKVRVEGIAHMGSVVSRKV